MQTLYDASRTAPYETMYRDGHVGGCWQIYAMQSFPGYGTKATMPDGTPMKNWWPYLYY